MSLCCLCVQPWRKVTTVVVVVVVVVEVLAMVVVVVACFSISDIIMSTSKP